MKVLKVFVLGLLYGWLVKFAFDRIYRDNVIEDIKNENTLLKEYIHSLEIQLQPKSLETLSVKRAVTQPSPAPIAKGKDDLKSIKGVGPAIEKKLNEAGIRKFSDMAQLTPGELETILGGTKRLVQSAGNMITQAKKLAQQKR
jgi:predicted flap endonuclease-1-like 5' DNA nuclease